jgi:hypothetical protein
MPSNLTPAGFDLAKVEDGGWLVNGRTPRRPVLDYLNGRTMDFAVWNEPVCPYCRCELRQRKFEDRASSEARWHYNREYILVLCHRCGHWEFEGFEGGSKCMDGSTGVIASSVVAKFPDQLPSGCDSELAQHLRRFPDAWHSLTPAAMERFVAAIFRANHSHCEVIHVGRPGDRGIDVIFVDSDCTRWLIQVKRRSVPKKAEGFSTLQSILGTLALEGERNGIIATTADYFSYQARQEQKRARQEGFVVEFLDKGILDRLVGALLPIDPWRELLARPELAHLDEEVSTYFGGDPAQLHLFA